jgi:hypothetical protein
MKTLQFNFSHPFKGRARVNMRGRPNFPCKQIQLDSEDSNLIEIPLDGFQTGIYQLTLDWELDNRFFIHQQDFEINDQPDLILIAL